MICNENNWIKLTGSRCNNLKNINICFPVGVITCVTGVSGSGKSSLVSQSLYPAIESRINGKEDISRYCDTLLGDDNFNKIIHVNQSPIGRTPRSNPATYTGIMDEIRKLFACTEEAKKRRYKVNKFSFNSKEGQCEVCHGEGRVCTPVSFMADIWTECTVCKGRRYKKIFLK